MNARTRQILWNVLALIIICAALIVLVHIVETQQQSVAVTLPTTATTTQAASVAVSETTATTTSPSPVVASVTPQSVPQQRQENTITTPATSSSPVSEATRVQDPYSTPAESFDTVNTDTRAALVNILCMPREGGSISPISGSGVIIDPRGIILTNAHVAQFVLLSESPEVDLSCSIRTGAPAQATWTASVLYIPTVWVAAHASEINTPDPMGTGEHDYALLYITGSANSTSLPAQFPYVPYDTRQAIAFLGDPVLVASYPAEFIGGIAAETDLYPDSSISSIGQLLTFGSGSVDVVSVGGVIEAQSGSSGGAVMNQWGRLVALITTTSAGSTTAQRDLRAVTLSYINTDLDTQTGMDLDQYLAGDPSSEVSDFTTNVAPGLLKDYLPGLENAGN